MLTHLGGSRAIALLVVATAFGALVPTLSRTIRSVPRPERVARRDRVRDTVPLAEAVG